MVYPVVMCAVLYIALAAAIICSIVQICSIVSFFLDIELVISLSYPTYVLSLYFEWVCLLASSVLGDASKTRTNILNTDNVG